MKPHEHASLFFWLSFFALLLGIALVALVVVLGLTKHISVLIYPLLVGAPSAVVAVLGRLILPSCEQCGQPMERVGRQTYAWRCTKCHEFIDSKVATGNRRFRS